ncbi:hypothetical protein CCACVL1_08495 [Corchorus capsularis]|uniref:Uncharacterized protein n=1 Tax=Corchorus capsularis TaxID=210143 RepID=A0A1R3J0B1_COCAP|nr:hypothetical protein CCACVL1_08495 [Corchorus capsularis]
MKDVSVGARGLKPPLSWVTYGSRYGG